MMKLLPQIESSKRYEKAIASYAVMLNCNNQRDLTIKCLLSNTVFKRSSIESFFKIKLECHLATSHPECIEIPTSDHYNDTTS